MGICSSCLGGRDDSNEAERARLLADDPYSQPHQNYGGNYGAWNQTAFQPAATQSLEDQKRERQAMDNIMRWASDQIVEIFPINSQRNQASSALHLHGSTTSIPQAEGSHGLTNSTHQDILLSMIPGDKSKRSIRIYPASRPTSKDAQSVRSTASHTKLNESVRNAKSRDGVFVQLKVDLP